MVLLDKFGGIVTVGIWPQTVMGNIAFVGDVVCQVKLIACGGVYFGLRTASILARCIKEGHLGDYDRFWKKELLFEIRIGLKARELYNRLDHKELERLSLLSKHQKDLIEEVADFENHSSLIMEIMKHFSNYPDIGRLLSIFFRKVNMTIHKDCHIR